MTTPCDNSTGNCSYWAWTDWIYAPCDNSTDNCSYWAYTDWMGSPCDNTTGNCSDKISIDGGYYDFGGQGKFGG